MKSGSRNSKRNRGQLTKNESPLVAFKKGWDFISSKMSDFIRFVEKLEYSELLVHCWRGGNSSQSVALLLEAAGLSVANLKIGSCDQYQKFVHRFSGVFVWGGYMVNG